MTIDVWMQQPTTQLLASDLFAPLVRWTGGAIPEHEPPIAATVEAMDAAGVRLGCLPFGAVRTGRTSSPTTKWPSGSGNTRTASGDSRRWTSTARWSLSGNCEGG